MLWPAGFAAIKRRQVEKRKESRKDLQWMIKSGDEGICDGWGAGVVTDRTRSPDTRRLMEQPRK